MPDSSPISKISNMLDQLNNSKAKTCHVSIYDKNGTRKFDLTNLSGLLDGANEDHNEFIVFSDKDNVILEKLLGTFDIVMVDSILDIFSYFKGDTYVAIIVLGGKTIAIQE